ncbi:DUF6622 family protein [Pseudaminobacter soli (ex Li et al. 2025)]|uniref:DUF2306 domain-containing protein n=1 Tax=Pseudaminobacter soli (ex Li et al. 2025) TaxID=1295366 RepID=A0A2P7SCG4_9HYPH|nr:DUF6622 family protein [Mesorhizobium soli]PSJ60204.1 hypothetical protein C7I85_13590 [Mesorhizobium soli]
MTLQPLLEASPVIQIHAYAAIAALLLGAAVLFRRKGDRLHKLGGRIWVGLMLIVALSSFFIHTIRMWGPWSPIHLLSILTLFGLAKAVMMIRQRKVMQHARIMKMVYFGGLVIAGFFTFMPGRVMHAVLFGAPEVANQPAAAPAPSASGPSLVQIVAGTPLWVWPLLAYALWAGWSMSRDRDTALWRMAVMPALMLGLSIYGLAASGLTLVSLAAYMVGAGLGAFIGQAVARRRPAEVLAGGMIRQKGDWLPFVLILGIFATRYVQGAALALHPELATNMGFGLGGAFLSGLFAATMIVRTLASLPSQALRQLPRPQSAK